MRDIDDILKRIIFDFAEITFQKIDEPTKEVAARAKVLADLLRAYQEWRETPKA